MKSLSLSTPQFQYYCRVRERGQVEGWMMGPWTEPGLALCVHRQTLAGLKDHSSRSPTGNGKPVLLSTLSSAVGLSQGKPCIGGRVSPGPLS